MAHRARFGNGGALGLIRRVKKPVRKLPPPRTPPSTTVVNITYAGPTGSVNFGDGRVPTIALVNKFSGDLGVPFSQLVASLGKYVNEHIAPVWGTPANLITADSVPSGAWGLVFSDTSDIAGALGYHDLTAEGLPLSHVFGYTTRHAGEKPSVVAAHEIVEMLVDPDIAITAQHPNGDFYAYEAADPVQNEEYEIDGVAVSNFIYPSYFEAFRAGRPGEKYDYLGTLTAPFSLRPGGYMPIYRCSGGGWTQIFGSEETQQRILTGGVHGQRFARRIGERKRSAQE